MRREDWGQEQVRGLDSVLIAVGGGGLIGGVASWYQDRVRVIAVEPERAPTLHDSLAAGHVVEVETGGVAADSLGARRVGELMFPTAQKFVTQSLLVSDEQIIEAQRVLWRQIRAGRLFPDNQLEFGDKVDDRMAVRPNRIRKGISPLVHFRLALDEDLPH